jgi:SagB-type dehydrogenase family enzyme
VYKKRVPAYLGGVPSFTERYHELTKYHPETIDRLGGVHWAEQPEPFKDAPSGRRVDLVPHLQAALRDIATPPDPRFPWLRDEALPALAALLHGTLGLTARLSTGGEGGPDHFLRAAPSAGGLYPTEVYVAVRNFPDLPAGIYHYHSLRNALIPVWEGDFFADLKHHFLDQPAVAECNCLVLFTGIYGRSAWRYKERAYRRILLDTGHAAANLLEMGEALGLDAVMLGGFYDEGIEELLFLGRKEEFPLLGVALGIAGSLLAVGGQRPGPLPEEAVQRAEMGDPMQVQQNACERIAPEDPLRAAVPSGPAMSFDTAGYNPQSVILHRRSTRRFNGGSITRRDAEDMLRFAFRSTGAQRESPLLTRDVIGFHLVAFAVEGLPSGVYALDPETLALTLRREGDFRGDLHAVSLGQDIAADCAFALVYTADMERLVSVYGDRGYRYACMDCGLIGERVQLWAVHRELGSSGIGGYYDDLANELLELPLSHGVLYLTVVGVPEE